MLYLRIAALVLNLVLSRTEFVQNRFDFKLTWDLTKFVAVGSKSGRVSKLSCGAECRNRYDCNLYTVDNDNQCKLYLGSQRDSLDDQANGVPAYKEPEYYGIIGPAKNAPTVQIRKADGSVCKTLPDFPRTDLYNGQILTVDGKKIFVFGGESTDSAHSALHVWKLDLSVKKMSWTQMKNMKRKRCTFLARQYKREVFLLAGEGCDGTSGGTQQIDVYDVDKNTWRTLTEQVSYDWTGRWIMPFSQKEVVIVYHSGGLEVFNFETESISMDLPNTGFAIGMAFRADFLDGTKGIVMSKKDTKELYFLDFANTGAGAVLQSQSTALEFDSVLSCVMQHKGHDVNLINYTGAKWIRVENWDTIDSLSFSYTANGQGAFSTTMNNNIHCDIVPSVIVGQCD